MKLLTANRSLGQNYFTNANLARKIVGIVTKTKPESIIEIGPGPGTFTNLLAKEAKVFAIEKDHQFADLLQQIINLSVEYIDVLQLNLSKFILENSIDPTKSIIFGSLPYNISKRIIANFIKLELVSDQYYIIQKEVAEKYTAQSPNSNILSLTSQIYCKSTKLLDISPGSFNPRPKVVSTLIHFHHKDLPSASISESKDKKEISSIDKEQVASFITQCFRQPRKTVNNNLRKSYQLDKLSPQLLHLLELRPEQLDLSDINQLFHELCNTKGSFQQ